MSTYYILKEPKKIPTLLDIVGKIDLVDNSDGKVAEKLLKSGQCKIAPFGYQYGGDFILRGFSLVREV